MKQLKQTFENFKGLMNVSLANNKNLVNLFDKYEEINMF